MGEINEDGVCRATFKDLSTLLYLFYPESMVVSGKLPTYPFPNLTFCPKKEVSVYVRFGEG